MNYIWKTRKISKSAGAALAVSLLFIAAVSKSAPAPTSEPGSVEITTVDSVSFDGVNFTAGYTMMSRCTADKHTTSISFDAITESYRRAEKVVALEIILTDTVNEGACNGERTLRKISYQTDLAAAAREEISDLVLQGYTIDPDYALALPPAWPSLDGSTSGGGVQFLKGDANCPKMPAAGAPAGAPAPVEQSASRDVRLSVVEYVPSWNCVLDKKSSASRNSFSGTGTTESAARNEAMMGCMRTNEPTCALMSLDPSHTTCTAEIKESTVVREFTASRAQDGNYLVAEIKGQKAQWACTLYKNDGARKDGFTGRGDTLDQARSDAASGCARTNHPSCREWAYDPTHTFCVLETN